MSILIPVGYEVSNRKSTSFKGIDLYKVTGVLYLDFPEFEYVVKGESVFLENSVGAYTRIKNRYLGIDSSNTPVIFTFNKDSYIGEKDLSSYYFKSVSKSGKTFYESKHTGFSIDIDNTVLLNIDLANHAYSITPITSVTDFVTVECCDSDENSFSVKSLYDIMETIDTGVYKLELESIGVFETMPDRMYLSKNSRKELICSIIYEVLDCNGISTAGYKLKTLVGSLLKSYYYDKILAICREEKNKEILDSAFKDAEIIVY